MVDELCEPLKDWPFAKVCRVTQVPARKKPPPVAVCLEKKQIAVCDRTAQTTCCACWAHATESHVSFFYFFIYHKKENPQRRQIPSGERVSPRCPPCSMAACIVQVKKKDIRFIAQHWPRRKHVTRNWQNKKEAICQCRQLSKKSHGHRNTKNPQRNHKRL